jgi:hypothetical protein
LFSASIGFLQYLAGYSDSVSGDQGGSPETAFRPENFGYCGWQPSQSHHADQQTLRTKNQKAAAQ